MPDDFQALPEKDRPEKPLHMQEAEPAGEVIRLHGKIARGVIRGRDMIEHFADRLEGLLGFRPYFGTLNIKVDKPVDIEDFETKRIQHVLLDGSLWIDARLAPIRMEFKDRITDAWIIVGERGLQENDVLEVIHKEKLMDKLGMKLDDDVMVELVPVRRDFKSKLKSRIRWLWPKSGRIG